MEQLPPKKVTSSFKFYNEYIDFDDKKKPVCVELTIEYLSKTFSITPEGYKNDKFFFSSGKISNATMCLAVLRAIEQAINFAKEELKEL